MKLSKVLMTVAAAAAVIGFAGCKIDEDDQNAFKGETYTFAEDITSGMYYRSFVTTATKHYSANAALTITAPSAVTTLTDAQKTQTYGSETKKIEQPVATGVVGFIFGVQKTSKDKYYVKDPKGSVSHKSVDCYDFGIVGVRYNKETGKIQCYVDWEKNVPDVVFGYNNSAEFNGTVYTDEACTTAEENPWGYETKIKPTGGNWADSSLTLDSTGKLNVFVKVTANDDGSYKVSVCNSMGVEDSAWTDVTIPATTTGLSAKTQCYIGRYISVYPGQSMAGTIAYSNVLGELIPAEYENIEE